MALSPMMQQYFAIKNQYKDYILLYRLGDFYEMFFDDAKTVSKELELVLTGRDCGEAERAPMCGIPFHKADLYIGKLIEHGHKVAVCEQTEDPATAKGLVRREIVRVVTPGTITDPGILDDRKNNYLCALAFSEAAVGAAFSDITTGKIYATVFTGGERINRLCTELSAYAPSEILLNVARTEIPRVSAYLDERMNGTVPEERQELFLPEGARDRIERYFGREKALSLTAYPETVSAVSAMIAYVAETQKTDNVFLNTLDFYLDGRYMELDVNTVRNLELTETLRTKEKQGSLLGVIDMTGTAMGGRMLRSRLLRPLLSVAEIRRRQQGVKDLFDDFETRQELRELLSSVLDLERLTTKSIYGSANARDLYAVGESIAVIPEIKARIAGLSSPLFRELFSTFDDLSDLRDLIRRAIAKDAPLTVREGGMIAPGYDEQVDFLRSVRGNGETWIRDVENREKEATGIKNLKVSYNRVFGYYIEVTNSQKELVPDRYIRKQTLTGSERYITEELKEIESTILGSTDKLCALEYNLFCEIRDKVTEAAPRILAAADKLAQIDVACSLAEAAAKYRYVCPEVDQSDKISVRDGRHPVVERFAGNSYFVPNDTELNTSDHRLMLITGPNMAGKSTYMRQVALITLLAQIGSFVPAREARIGIADRIFTRVGASDDLASGQSTFMLEMNEVAYILRNATARSLIIFDEIGRGTSTYDGMSIARAVAEYTASKKIGARTLFATHYHEMTVLEEEIPGVVNYNIAAKKKGDTITFLRKIVPGSTDDSYGIEVAKLAGIPSDVIRRAKEILRGIEENAPLAEGRETLARAAQTRGDEPDTIFSQIEEDVNREIADRLAGTDLNTLTPIEAINLIWELKGKLKS